MASITAAIPRPTSYTTGVWGWLTTVDHKKIGVLYGVSAVMFFLVGGIEAGVMRAQLARPATDLVDPDTFNAMFTMHGTTMIFMAIMPLGAAFFNIIIPLAIGARDVAFPRLNALSYWVFLFGALLMHVGFLVNAVPDAGWFSYANLTSLEFSPGAGLDYWAIGLQILGVASLAAGFNFIVTIVNMRAPGMSMMRMPLFVWMTLITSILLVLAFPVITVGLIELTFDRLFGANFFVTSAGGDPILWQHLFWVFGHPEVYILILPAMGIVSEILPTFSRKPLFGYPVVVFSGIVIGIMGWAVWSHHMFTVGLGPIPNSVFTITTMLIAVPTGVKIFNWMATLWGGSIDLKTPLLFSVGFIALFIVGGLSGVSHAVSPSDNQQQDTYYIVAHLHYVLFGGSLMGLFAGIYYWFPKMTGRFLNEFWGKVHFWLFFLGMNITFFPMHYAGLNGMPRRIYTYNSEFGWDLMNLISSAGYIVLFAGAVLFLVIFIQSVRNGKPSGHDPWDAPTLEWSISSPPPPYNFAEIPQVEGRDHYWIVKRRAAAEGHPLTEPEAHVDTSTIHMPSPSYWPLVIALGIAGIGGGLLIEYPWPYIKFPLSFVGGIIAFFGVIGWANEPAAADSHAAIYDEDVVGAGRYILSFLLAGFVGLAIQYGLRKKGWTATGVNVIILGLALLALRLLPWALTQL